MAAARPTTPTGPSKYAHIEWGQMDKTRFNVLMPFGSLSVRAIVYPANLIRIRLQSGGEQQYRGTFHAFRSIVTTEGPRALYKGFGFSLLNLPVGSVYMAVFESSRSYFKEWAATTSLPPHFRHLFVQFAAGFVSSGVSQTLVVPVDIITQQRMLQRLPIGVPRESTPHIIQRIARAEGIRGFYRGYFISMATFAPSSALMWTVFGGLQTFLQQHVPYPPGADASPESPWDNMPTLWRDVAITAFSGAVAGSVSGALTNPLDVLRTQAQTDPNPQRNVRRLLRELTAQSGLRWCLRGMTARMLAQGPTTMLLMITYELLKRSAYQPSDITVLEV